MQLQLYLSMNQKILITILLCYIFTVPRLCVGFSSHAYCFTQFIFHFVSVSVLPFPISLLHFTQRKQWAWLHNQPVIWFSKFGPGTLFLNIFCYLTYHTVKFFLCFFGVLFHLFLLNCQILFFKFNSSSQGGCCVLLIDWYNHFDPWDIVKLCIHLTFMGPCIVLIFWHIIPTRYTSHGVYFWHCCTCFGRYYHPSSGAQNSCNYSIWLPLHRTAVCCFRGRVGTDLNWICIHCLICGCVCIFSLLLLTHVLCYLDCREHKVTVSMT